MRTSLRICSPHWWLAATELRQRSWPMAGGTTLTRSHLALNRFPFVAGGHAILGKRFCGLLADTPALMGDQLRLQSTGGCDSSWRTICWHNRRFRRRVDLELGRRLASFDAVYVHGDVELAAQISALRPTVLRLPGPVAEDCREILERVHVVCANGDALCQLQAFLTKAVELPAGIDGQRFKPGPTDIRKRLGWSESQLVVGYVGRLTRLKGVDLLASAFRQLRRSLPNLRLLLIGSGEAEITIRSVLAEEIAGGLVHATPDVAPEQLPQWYRAMDVFVMPSRYENHSNALLEAMACGLPFVASEVGGNRQLNQTGAGWFFESESVPSLTACLERVLNSSADIEYRGELGRRYIQQRFSWTLTAVRLESLLSSICA